MTWQDDPELHQLANELKQAKPPNTPVPNNFYIDLRQKFEGEKMAKTNSLPMRVLTIGSALTMILLLSGVFWLSLRQESIAQPITPIRMNHYDGWEAGIAFDYPADWQVYDIQKESETTVICLGTKAITCGQAEVTIESGDVLGVLLISATSLKMNEADMSLDELAQALMENRLNEVTVDPNHAIESGTIDGYPTRSTIAHWSTGHAAYETIMVMETHTFQLMLAAPLAEVERLMPQAEALLTSVTATNYDGWQRLSTDSLDFAIAYPEAWSLHDNNGKSLQISSSREPNWSSRAIPNETAVWIDVMHNLNRQISEEPLAEVTRMFDEWSGRKGATIQAPSLYPARPDIAWAAFEVEADVVFIAAVRQNDEYLPPILLTMVATETEHQLIFERVLRSVEAKTAVSFIPPADHTPIPVTSNIYTLSDYPPSDTPYKITQAGFWLVHTVDGQLFAFAVTSPTYRPDVTIDECEYAWVLVNQRFEDPCSGDEWEIDGTLNLEASSELWSTRNLDQYPITMPDDNSIAVQLQQLTEGEERVMSTLPAAAQSQYGVTMSVIEAVFNESETLLDVQTEVDALWGMDPRAFPPQQAVTYPITVGLLFDDQGNHFAATSLTSELATAGTDVGSLKSLKHLGWQPVASESQNVITTLTTELTNIPVTITETFDWDIFGPGTVLVINRIIDVGYAQLLLQQVEWLSTTDEGLNRLRLTIVDNSLADLEISCLFIDTTPPDNPSCQQFEGEGTFIIETAVSPPTTLHLRANVTFLTPFQLTVPVN